MRRCFGIALLGLVSSVLSGLLYSGVHATDLDGAVLTVIDLVLVVALIGGAIAVLVGAIGVGVAAVRRPG